MPEPGAVNLLFMSFIELQSVGSTNNYAREQIHAGLAQDGAVFFTREQVAGKGQRSKSWASGRDTSILMSIIIDPHPLQVSEQFFLSAAIATSAAVFFNKLTNGDTTVKWPNDLYWQDRKAGGILIENIIGGTTWKWAIAGIGININQECFSPELPNAVSLRQITGKTYECTALAKELAAKINDKIVRLKKGNFKEAIDQYNEALYKKGELVKFKKGGSSFRARVKEVAENGSLVLNTGKGEEGFGFGELEWIITQ